MKRSGIMRMLWNNKPVPNVHLPTMSVTSALTFEQATSPHNTQTSRSGCAFVGVLSCAQRHRMLDESTTKGTLTNCGPDSGQSAKQIVDSFKRDVPSGFVHNNDDGNIVGADPYAFADYLFETVDRTWLVGPTHLNFALEMAEEMPFVFTSLPVTKAGHCVVYSKEEFVKEFHDKHQLPKEERVWHTQCVVGSSVDTATQERYFVCLQSWEGCLFTFIPAMSAQEIIEFSRRPANKKTLSIPTDVELHLEKKHEVIFPRRLEDTHAPSLKEFTADEVSGMLIPPMRSGYLRKRRTFV